MKRRRHPNDRDEPLVQLNRWQLTGALLGLGLIVVLVFFTGVVVGRQSTAPLPPELTRIAASASAQQAEARPKRGLELVTPGTRGIDEDLSRPPRPIVPRDRKEAARIEAHRQLQDSRAHGVAGLDGPEGDGGAHPVAALPVAVQPASDGSGGAHTLQVSAFETAGPAEAIAGELRQADYPVVVRRINDRGRVYWRVEVGRFDSSDEATRYQRTFEQRSGLSTVMVPSP